MRLCRDVHLDWIRAYAEYVCHASFTYIAHERDRDNSDWFSHELSRFGVLEMKSHGRRAWQGNARLVLWNDHASLHKNVELEALEVFAFIVSITLIDMHPFALPLHHYPLRSGVVHSQDLCRLLLPGTHLLLPLLLLLR